MTTWIVQLKQQLGFTVVELLVVMILVSIVAVSAIPRWTTSPMLDATIQQLLSDLRYTQMLAITHGQGFRMNFTLPSAYNITGLSGTAVPNLSTGANTTTLFSGVIISGVTHLPNALIAFDGKGIPYVDSAATTALTVNATITLSANGTNRYIVVTPQTGSMVAQ